jgi:hypothetical protein
MSATVLLDSNSLVHKAITMLSQDDKQYTVTFLVTVDGVLDWQLDLLDQLLQHVVTLYSSL